MCRRIPLKKAALQEHVQTEWSEAQGMSAFITPPHTQKHTLKAKHCSSAWQFPTPLALVKISLLVYVMLWVFLENSSRWLRSNSLNQQLAPCLNLASWLNHRCFVFSMDTEEKPQNTPALWQHAPKSRKNETLCCWEELSCYVSWKQTRVCWYTRITLGWSHLVSLHSDAAGVWDKKERQA